MYRFIDVTEIQDEFFTSPDSFTINGILPESKILGYHTLNVSGREMLSSEVGEKDISHADGTIYLYKRDLPRELVVTYQLIAPNPEEFMRRFNALCAMLNGEQMQIIFNDEQDKYFTATKSSVELPEPGRLAVTGTYTLYCTDPYKYALKEKTIETTGVSTILNNGTKECPIRLNMYREPVTAWFPGLIRIRTYKYGTFDDRIKTFDIEDNDKVGMGVSTYLDFENLTFTSNGKSMWYTVSWSSEPILLIPGIQKLSITPFEGTISFRERWL